MSRMIAFILISTFYFTNIYTAPAQGTHPIPEREMDDLSSKMKDVFSARMAYDRATALDSMMDMSDMIAELEEDHGIDDLLRFPDMWSRIREGAIDGSDSIFKREGWGFQEGEFVDRTEIPPKKYVYLISLPEEYDPDGTRRFPVIIFLHPEIKGRYRKLAQEVSDLAEALYGDEDLLDNYIIIAPVGPLEGKGRREKLIDAGKDWEDLEIGRMTAFIAVRLLLEQMVFDRSKVFIHGIGKAGLSAFRYVTWYPSLFAGAIGRDAEISPLAMENAAGISLLYVSSSENDKDKTKAAAQWAKEHSKNAADDMGAQVTFMEDMGKLLEPSNEAHASLRQWMDRVKKDNSTKTIHLKACDLSTAGAYWLRITELNVGLNTKLTDPDCAWIKAKVDSETNSIVLESQRILKTLVFLNDKIIDLDKKVTILVNGKTGFEGRVERDLEKMLDLIYYNMAGGFEIYCNYLELTLEN